jgi:hypothetical protein
MNGLVYIGHGKSNHHRELRDWLRIRFLSLIFFLLSLGFISQNGGSRAHKSSQTITTPRNLGIFPQKKEEMVKNTIIGGTLLQSGKQGFIYAPLKLRRDEGHSLRHGSRSPYSN